jgi:hypothetical protein
MTHAEDQLQEFKNAVFNAGKSPARAYVEYFADVMRWPVDAFTSRTLSETNRFEHHVAWLKGNVIGHASFVAVNDTPAITTTVHPISTIVRVEVHPHVQHNGVTLTVTRSMTIHFTTGEPLTIDLSTYTAYAQREGAIIFIDAVVDALAAQSDVNEQKTAEGSS